MGFLNRSKEKSERKKELHNAGKVVFAAKVAEKNAANAEVESMLLAEEVEQPMEDADATLTKKKKLFMYGGLVAVAVVLLVVVAFPGKKTTKPMPTKLQTARVPIAVEKTTPTAQFTPVAQKPEIAKTPAQSSLQGVKAALAAYARPAKEEVSVEQAEEAMKLQNSVAMLAEDMSVAKATIAKLQSELNKTSKRAEQTEKLAFQIQILQTTVEKQEKELLKIALAKQAQKTKAKTASTIKILDNSNFKYRNSIYSVGSILEIESKVYVVLRIVKDGQKAGVYVQDKFDNRWKISEKK